MEPDNPRAIRILAHELALVGDITASIRLFDKLVRIRGEEPQSHRDLALVLIKRGDDGSLTRAASLLWHVVTSRWDARFRQVREPNSEQCFIVCAADRVDGTH